MKNSSFHSKEIEDAEIADFLKDIDIALGHDYQQPGRQLFPKFSPEFHTFSSDELPLFERLARAYNALEDSRKPHARLIVQKALVRCARTPLGLKRSLVCVDLAHEIDPVLASEAIYSDLMFRPTNTDELAVWLWELIRRWKKWNIKVESNPECWKKATREVVPKGILDLLLYFHAQNASENPKCWALMRRIALTRIKMEEPALLAVGYDPYILFERISSLLLPQCNCHHSHQDHDDKTSDYKLELSQLEDTLPDWIKKLPMQERKEEIEWFDWGQQR